ncbi:hypothetical protein [Nocardia shimofusensis]|uniref:hypothetical protein n=1 Tax=Nocardia shimofusensis TaxID=228596 RepID=UPI000830BB6B|nr:hypothetical protein [Nocardia shimofusensis]
MTVLAPAEEYGEAERAPLHTAGISREEVVGIRERVGALMFHYNFVAMAWEWVAMGLHDLLLAACGPLVAPEVRAELGDLPACYDWAVRIAERHR